MYIASDHTQVIEFPINITKAEMLYLARLIKKDERLYLKKGKTNSNTYDSLRSRKYIKANVLEMEEHVPLAVIHNLIRKQYMVIAGTFEDFYIVKPSKNIVDYLRNVQKPNKKFEVDSLKGVSFEALEKVSDYEKKTLISKGTRQQLPNYQIRLEMARNGLDSTYLYCLETIQNKAYVLYQDSSGYLFQVYPENLGVKKPKGVPVEITSVLKDDYICIESNPRHTGFIRAEKPKALNIDVIKNDFKEACKKLKTYGVRTKGKKEVFAFLNSETTETFLKEWNREAEKVWQELYKESEKLAKVGIVQGGFPENPQYLKAWELQNKLERLYQVPKYKTASRYVREINEVLNIIDVEIYVTYSF